MSEIEKLREVLRCIADLPMDRCSTENDYRLSAAKAAALGALSQQTEPAPAQDEDIYEGTYSHLCELLAPHTVDAGGRLPASVCDAFRVMLDAFLARPAQTEQQPIRLPQRKQKGWQCELGVYPADGWNAALDEVARLNATRPAQTEQTEQQQPVGHQFQDRQGVWKQFMSERHYEDTLADGTWPIRAIYAAPIAQTEQQPVAGSWQSVAWKALDRILHASEWVRDAVHYQEVAQGLANAALVAYRNAAPIAQTAPQSGKVIAYRTLDRHGNLVTDWIDGDPEGGEPIVPGGSFQLAYAAPQPEQSGLVEALSEAVEALQEAGDFRAAGKGEKALSSYHAALSAQGESHE